MAIGDLLGPAGGGGGNWQAVSPLVIPELMEMFKRAGANVPNRGELRDVNSFVQQGVNSPLLQAILEPALANLMRGEDDRRMALADQFRAAGGLRGSQYGKSAVSLEGEMQNAQGQLISQLTAQTLSPLLQSMLAEQQQQFLPAKTLADILTAVRPDVHFGSQGGGGGAGGGGGGGGIGAGSPGPLMGGNLWGGGGQTFGQTDWLFPGYGPQPGAPGGLYNPGPDAFNPFGGSDWPGAYQPPAGPEFDWNAYENSFEPYDSGMGPGQPIAYNPDTGFYETPNLGEYY